MRWEPAEERTSHVPLLVTAVMTEPIITAGEPMHLDGMVAYAAWRDGGGQNAGGLPEWPDDFDVPLSQWRVRPGEAADFDPRLLDRDGFLWGFRSSAEQAAWLQRGGAEVRKRPAVHQMVRYAKESTAQLNGGPLKAYDLTMPTVFAHRVQWYAHGDGDEVLRLLRRWIGAIGRKRGHGWGVVARWEVEQVAADQSVDGADGRLMRRMPAACGYDGVLSEMGIRPPYHHVSRRTRTTEPARPC